MSASFDLNVSPGTLPSPRKRSERQGPVDPSTGSYVFADSSDKEHDRLRLLASLLDPVHRQVLERAGVAAGTSCMEMGAGTGSIAAWMAGRVGAGGQVVAADINVSFLDDLSDTPNLAIRQFNVLADPLPDGAFDIITARALLHHLPSWEAVVARWAAALKPGGALVLIEPDAGVGMASAEDVHRRFWSGWCQWGESVGVDFRLGGKLPKSLQAAGLDVTSAAMEVPFYTGESPWATLFLQTLQAAKPRLGSWIDPDLVAGFEAACADPGNWTSSLGWMAVVGRRGLGRHGEPPGVRGLAGPA
jgi:ubiquinone/menaquinone biosynthesis C-methylase UbiE